jgi:helix-turn-helix protein
VKSNSVHRFEELRLENPTSHDGEALDIGANQYNIARKPTALRQVPNQRLFGPKAASRYLGICEDTLKKITDLEQIRAFKLNGRRAYRLEDLEQFIASLPGWYDDPGEKSAKVVEKGNHDL